MNKYKAFKPGVKIRCIDAGASGDRPAGILVLNKVYEIEYVEPACLHPMCKVKNVDNLTWSMGRFELVTGCPCGLKLCIAKHETIPK